MATNNILNKTNASNLIPAEINAVVAIIENPKANTIFLDLIFNKFINFIIFKFINFIILKK